MSRPRLEDGVAPKHRKRRRKEDVKSLRLDIDVNLYAKLVRLAGEDSMLKVVEELISRAEKIPN